MIGRTAKTRGPRQIRAAIGATGLAIVFAGAMLAPWIAPADPAVQHAGFAFAPPMRIRLVDAHGGWHRPFVHPLRLADPIERRFVEDTSSRVPLRFFARGRLVTIDPAAGPLLLLGADALGRDVLSRLLFGARVSLGVALAGVLGALVLGAIAGTVAGYTGGWTDEVVMRIADFLLVLPALYVVLAIRAALPLVLEPLPLLATVAAVLALAGWPIVARAVRGAVAVDSRREYIEAARAVGASPARIVLRHLLPAIGGLLAVHGALLLPAFVAAEATLSFAGLGLAEPVASWGTMLRQDAANLAAIAEFPWLLAPAVAMALVTLLVDLTTAGRAAGGMPAPRAA
ncbi:MAG TPA: ABC transporter permease [Vicinamibacterales bacterium]|nr:ABC transporter permease [Vicinamibacterales bacterium]